MKDKFKQLLKDEGCAIHAAQALFKALREERHIYLRLESLPEIFNLKRKSNERTDKDYEPESLRDYAGKHGLITPEEVMLHLQINGAEIDCSDYLVKHPLIAKFVDAERTFKSHPELKTSNPYQSAKAYLNYLIKNGIVPEGELLQNAIPTSLLEQMAEPEEIFDIHASFALMLRACPGWLNMHEGMNKYYLGNFWYLDIDKIYERRLKSLPQIRTSHGICKECEKNFSGELDQDNSTIR